MGKWVLSARRERQKAVGRWLLLGTASVYNPGASQRFWLLLGFARLISREVGMAGLAWGCSDKSLHLQVDQERTGQICPCRWQAEGLRHPVSSASVGSFFTTFVWAMSRCVLVGHLVF